MRKFLKIIIPLILLSVLLFILFYPKNDIVYIAHKGAFEGYNTTENSLNAFKTSYDNGYNNLEMDIQFTKDNVPILDHDIDDNIKDYNYNSVSSKYTSFEDILKFADGKNVTLYPELKEPITDSQMKFLDDMISKYDVNIVFQVSYKSDFDLVHNKYNYKTLILPFNNFSNYSVKDLVDFSNENNVFIGFDYYDLSTEDLDYINQNMENDIYWTLDN